MISQRDAAVNALPELIAENERLKADRDAIRAGAADMGKDAKHVAERLRRHAASNYARSENTDEQWASALDLAMLIQGIIGRPLPNESEMSPLALSGGKP